MFKLTLLGPTSAQFRDDAGAWVQVSRHSGLITVQVRTNDLVQLWDSKARGWTLLRWRAEINEPGSEPRWWNDKHWAMVDEGLAAIDTFNSLYKDKEFP